MHHKADEAQDDALLETVSKTLIGAAVAAHKALEPGLLEPTEQKVMEIEVQESRIPFVPQTPLSVQFKGHVVEDAYPVDLLLEDELVVELKRVQELEPIHEAPLHYALN